MKKTLVLLAIFCLLVISSREIDCKQAYGLYSGSIYSAEDLTHLTPRRAIDSIDFGFEYFSTYYSCGKHSLQDTSETYLRLIKSIDSIVIIGATPLVICILDDSLKYYSDGSLDSLMTVFLRKLSSYNIKILISFGPEMNGYWFSYGQKPGLYKQAFKHFYEQVKAIDTNLKVCWVPNFASGYPYPEGDQLLDPTKAYSDYYPGDDSVDYVGLNFYAKDYTRLDSVDIYFFDYCMSYLEYYQIYGKNHKIIISEASAFDPSNSVLDLATGRIPLTVAEQKKFQSGFLAGVIRMMKLYPKIEIFIFFHVMKVEDGFDELHKGDKKFGDIVFDFRLPFDVFKDILLSVESTANITADLLVYPNPATDKMAIVSLDLALDQVKVFNEMGQLMITKNTNDYYQQLELSNLARGIYFLQIKRGHNLETVKISLY